MEKKLLEEITKIVGTHKKDDELGYCDTGEDMEYGCRSECVQMAVKRLEERFGNTA